jgi:hypothetical protein
MVGNRFVPAFGFFSMGRKRAKRGADRRTGKKGSICAPNTAQGLYPSVVLRDKVYADFRTSYEQGLRTPLERLNPPLNADYLKALTSGKRETVIATFESIEHRKKPLYREQLINKLASLSVRERIAALTGLYFVRDRDVVGHMIRMAGDSSSSVRRFAVFYMGEMRAKNSLSVVSQLLSDKSAEVRAAAREAYKKLGGAGKASL